MDNKVQHLIDALHYFELDPHWIAFKQQDGTIRLPAIVSAACVNPLYACRAQVLVGLYREVVVFAEGNCQAKHLSVLGTAGFNVKTTKVKGGDKRVITTKLGLLLAE